MKTSILIITAFICAILIYGGILAARPSEETVAAQAYIDSLAEEYGTSSPRIYVRDFSYYVENFATGDRTRAVGIYYPDRQTIYVRPCAMTANYRDWIELLEHEYAHHWVRQTHGSVQYSHGFEFLNFMKSRGHRWNDISFNSPVCRD